MTIDDDGTVLYSTGLGHGDALHVSDLDPARPGLEVFAVHEEAPHSKGIGATFRDAATGRGALVDAGHRRHRPRGLGRHRRRRTPGAESWAVVADGTWNSRVGRAAGGRRRAAQHHHPRGELPHLVGRRPPAGDHRPRLGHDGAHGRPDDRQVEPVDETVRRDLPGDRHPLRQRHQGHPRPAGRPVRRLARGDRHPPGRLVGPADRHHGGPHRPPAAHPAVRPGVPPRRRVAEHRLQPAAAHGLLPGRRHGDAAGAEHRLHGRRHGSGRAGAGTGDGGAGARACCPATTGTTTAATRSP